MQKTLVRNPRRILVTGGLGFIGVNFVRYLLSRHLVDEVLIYDKQTYAVNPKTVAHLERDFLGKFLLINADICDQHVFDDALRKFRIDTVVHFAAESHVDKSITGPGEFIRTNINGTFSLLEAIRKHKSEGNSIHFHHVSTDEVYGALGDTGFFTEETPYKPNSPYSASKAASDHLVRAYHKTYDLNVTLTNCSNNYGPYHFPEKLIPLTITNALNKKPLPIYGLGLQVRDWLFVEDHADAIWTVVCRSAFGESYNIGGHNEWKNKDVVTLICEMLAEQKKVSSQEFLKLITYVSDRPGHDYRYAIDSSKIAKDFGWHPKHEFHSGLKNTIGWFLENEEWTRAVQK